MSELICRIGELLFRQPPEQRIALRELYLALPGYDDVMIGNVLHRMRQADLIEATFQNDAVRLSREGREVWNDGSIVEVTLGTQYVIEQYAPATVHIIVTGVDGENAASGFFCTSYPDWIVTAAHVIAEREILRINNLRGEVIATPPFERDLPVNGLDLTLIRCDCPPGVRGIRIDWRRDAVIPMDPLLVLGYPSLPNLLPGLDHIGAELRQVARDFRGERDYLVISSVTLPGSSGGPVLNRRGRAVGVVEQDNIREQQGQATIHAFTATPTRYLEELRKPS